MTLAEYFPQTTLADHFRRQSQVHLIFAKAAGTDAQAEMHMGLAFDYFCAAAAVEEPAAAKQSDCKSSLND